MSLICSGEKTALVESRGLEFRQVLAFVHHVDLILVEGWKAGAFPQIGISRAATGKGFTHDPGHFAALVTDEAVEAACPVFGLDEVEALADFIQDLLLPAAPVQERAQASACLALKEETLRQLAGAEDVAALARLLGREGEGCNAALRVLEREGLLEVTAAAAPGQELAAMEAACAAALRVCSLLQPLQELPEIRCVRSLSGGAGREEN